MKTNSINNQESHDPQDLKFPTYETLSKHSVAMAHSLLLFSRIPKKNDGRSCHWDRKTDYYNFPELSDKKGAVLLNVQRPQYPTRDEVLAFGQSNRLQFLASFTETKHTCVQWSIKTSPEEIEQDRKDLRSLSTSLALVLQLLLVEALAQGSSWFHLPLNTIEQYVGGTGSKVERATKLIKILSRLRFEQWYSGWNPSRSYAPLMCGIYNEAQKSFSIALDNRLIEMAYPHCKNGLSGRLLREFTEHAPEGVSALNSYIYGLEPHNKLSRKEKVKRGFIPAKTNEDNKIALEPHRYVKVSKGALVQSSKMQDVEIVLHHFLFHNLTKTALNAKGLKTFLIDDQEMLASLGNFRNSPCSGFTLKGIQSTQPFLNKATVERLGGSKKLLSVLVNLVEKKLGGKVKAKLPGQEVMISSNEALKNYPVRIMEKMTLFCYLPLTFITKIKASQRVADPVLDNVVEWGAKIKAYRGKKTWTQSDLANELGVDRVSLSLWENGKRPVPHIHQVALQEMLQEAI